MNCKKCKVKFQHYFLKDGVCRGCLYPELVVKSVRQEYVVEDWAGNVLTNEGKFKPRNDVVARVFESFDAASDALTELYSHLDDAEFDSQMGEVFIVERWHK